MTTGHVRTGLYRVRSYFNPLILIFKAREVRRVDCLEKAKGIYDYRVYHRHGDTGDYCFIIIALNHHLFFTKQTKISS